MGIDCASPTTSPPSTTGKLQVLATQNRIGRSPGRGSRFHSSRVPSVRDHLVMPLMFTLPRNRILALLRGMA
jgi:hypothetical protein